MHDPIARRLQTAYEDPTSYAISSYHDRVTIVTRCENFRKYIGII